MSNAGSAKSDVALGGISSLIACGLLIPSFQQAERVFLLPGDISPFLVPKLFLFVWIALSVTIFLKGLLAWRSDEVATSPQKWFAVLSVLGVIALATIMMEPLGFLIVSPSAFFVCSYLLGFRNHFVNLAVAIGACVGLYGALVQLANLSLPPAFWQG